MTRGQSKPSDMISAPEPALQELLDDPIVRLVMEADGVREADLADLVAVVRRRVIAARWRGTPTAPVTRRQTTLAIL